MTEYTLITGASGYIGGMLARYYSSIPLILLSRDIARIPLDIRKMKGVKVFQFDLHKISHVEIFEQIKEMLGCPGVDFSVSSVIHCASVTASSEMVEHPVETADSIVLLTRSILELSRLLFAKKVVLLSSMEVYGEVLDIGRARGEEELGTISLTDPRSSYPLGKRMAEFYGRSFFLEYGLSVCIARLSQTFGRGVRPSDNRVYMQFARAVLEKKDIVLKTKGESYTNNCSIDDVISAIDIIIERGIPGETYNVVNEENTMTIYEMASLVSKKLAGGEISVVIDEDHDNPYAKDTFLRMSGQKLRALGFEPKKDIVSMYEDITKGEPKMTKFEQIKLNYGAGDYAPVINQETIETHHGKHHKTYTDTLNKLVEENNIECSSIEDLLSNLDRIGDESVRTAVRNNGGGFYNHNLYFETLAPKDKAKHSPEGELLSKIDEAFGSFDELKAKLKALALGQFGSGWAFLSVTPEGKLVATKSPNQDNPFSEKSGNKPIACIDVWEHAYYLDYKNLRAAYVDALFDIIDWGVVERKYEEAK